MSRKPENLIVGVAVAMFAVISAHAQDAFHNLNFEQATVTASGPEPYPNFVPIGSALPGWTAYLGTQQITQVGYNSPTLSVATVCLIGTTWNTSDVQDYGFGIIDGNYSVDLETGITPLNPTTSYINASIEQNGTVPSTTASLQFKEAGFGPGPVSVSFDGNALVPVALSSGVSADGLPYTLFGVNISAWAGHAGELEFSTSSTVDYAYAELDDITFSPMAVPEPSMVALSAIGGLLFGARKWFARP
jgi:hypothetical protein